MKISQLCKMIEDSIHGGKYPLEDQQKRFANSLQVVNRSDSDDLKSSEIKIEVRILGLYIISNYVPNIEHLPGVIEVGLFTKLANVYYKAKDDNSFDAIKL